jgi:sulfate adenylyltransferase
MVLPVEKELEKNGEVLLAQSGRPVARLRVRECYPLDRKAFAKGVYGTEDPAHPNVAEIQQWPPFLAAGPVDLIARPETDLGESEPTPAETRAEFRKRGWETVVGYQTRNPPHRAHEYLQRCALEQVDGLFIHPVVGKLKADDFPAAAILESYRTLVGVYPPGRFFLSPLSIAMRYAGPRAAVFLALVRKNYGCTHYIVGRDMAGVGKFYGPYDAQEALARWDLGITPLPFQDVFWCDKCGSMATEKTCGHPPDARKTLSGTEVRRRLRAGEPVPQEMVRPEVVEVLRKHAG